MEVVTVAKARTQNIGQQELGVCTTHKEIEGVKEAARLCSHTYWLRGQDDPSSRPDSNVLTYLAGISIVAFMMFYTD